MFSRYHPVRYVLLVALITLSACAPQAKPTPTPAPVAGPVTLQLAVSDEQGNPSEIYANEFADQVKTLSNGQITIEPTWNAGQDTEAGFEAGVIQLVKAGKADLGLAASRAWITQDIPSFQALQAPFLIDNDALAKAVATSDISAKMLDGLSQFGIVGLTLWPEDLRHPFSTLAGKPILSPADFPGRTIRVTSETARRLVEAMGAKSMSGEGNYQGAESGLRQAKSLSGAPTATANVTFFPKYQVLFANAAAFNKLSDAQKAILREAAAAAQEKAIADYPGDAAAAQTWCSDVGAVVLASPEQIAAFQKAAQPVFDWIEQDPQSATLVAAIRELKAKTPASPAVQACGSDVAAQAPTQSADTQTWSTDLIPNGTYQVTLTNEDVMKMGVSKANAPDWSGIYAHTFKDGVFHSTWQGTEGSAQGQTAVCDGTYKLVQDYVSIQLNSDCGNEVDNIRWRIDADGLHFQVVEILNGKTTEVTALFEAKPYQKVEQWSQGLIPNGVYQVTLTGEDVMKMGVSKANAADWSGIFTHTFKDGVFHTEWQGTEGSAQGQTSGCDGTYELVQDYVSIKLSSDCGNEVDNIRWRIDADGVHFQVVEIQNGMTTEGTAVFEAKPYQKIGE